MSEDPHPSEENDTSMSEEDLAILKAFDAMESWQPSGEAAPIPHTTEFSQQDMLLLFAAEMDEDIAQMKRALNGLEQGDTFDETRFIVLRRAAHKVRGTAGAMECGAMASIASHIEEVVTQITTGLLHPLLGLNALVNAVLALEVTLHDILTHGKESDEPLKALERELQQISEAQGTAYVSKGSITAPLSLGAVTPAVSASEQSVQLASPLTPSISIETQRFEGLLRLSESLAETRTPLENAQEQVDLALNELHAAQQRLQGLERALIELSRPARTSGGASHLPTSSLIERMLKEAGTQKSVGNYTPHKRLALRAYEKTEWDELELDRYNERDKIVANLRDAIAGVTLCTTLVQRAYAQLHTVMQQYMERATELHTAVHLVRLTPFGMLVPHLQQVVTTYAPHVRFEVSGETTEIDKDVLDALVVPLSTLLRACIVDIGPVDDGPQHVTLSAQALGNEVTVELGLSMTVQGGALDTVQPLIGRLRGTIELQRNAENGVSFFLRFPRSQGTVRGLLVRVADQHVVVPFSQVQYVGDEQQHKTAIIYHLHKLLNYPYEPSQPRRVTPLLVLPQGRSRLAAGILVDEVVSDITVVIKPLPHYLRRPGVAGTALDSKGNVLLLLDIPVLIKHYTLSQRHALPEETGTPKTRKTQRLVLVADDSALLRKSLIQTLEQAHFATVEAGNGLDALDVLTQNPPDVFLLDMEMPYMNGYDLLNIMHIYPELADVKIIMLTSRTNEKYKQRALDLGADVYLEKPCPPDVLLATIEEVLQ